MTFSNKIYIVKVTYISIIKNIMEVMVLLFKQKTKLSKGSATNNSVRTTLPSTIARMMDVHIGDKIEWTVESVNDELTITVSKVE